MSTKSLIYQCHINLFRETYPINCKIVIYHPVSFISEASSFIVQRNLPWNWRRISLPLQLTWFRVAFQIAGTDPVNLSIYSTIEGWDWSLFFEDCFGGTPPEKGIFHLIDHLPLNYPWLGRFTFFSLKDP